MEEEKYKYRYSKPIEPVKILKGAEKIKERLLVAKGNITEFKDKIKDRMEEKKERNEELNVIRNESYEDERERRAVVEGRMRARKGSGVSYTWNKVSNSIRKMPIASGKITIPDINLGQSFGGQRQSKQSKKTRKEFDFGSVL